MKNELHPKTQSKNLRSGSCSTRPCSRPASRSTSRRRSRRASTASSSSACPSTTTRTTSTRTWTTSRRSRRTASTRSRPWSRSIKSRRAPLPRLILSPGRYKSRLNVLIVLASYLLVVIPKSPDHTFNTGTILTSIVPSLLGAGKNSRAPF